MASSWCFCSWPRRSCRWSSSCAASWSAAASGPSGPARPEAAALTQRRSRRRRPRPLPRPLPAGSDPTAAAAPPADRRSQLLQSPRDDEAPPKENAEDAEPPAPKPRSRGRPSPASAALTRRRRPRQSRRCAPPARTPAASRDAAASTEPHRGGYAVQIAALNIRSEADAIAKRLPSKGYAAYVMSPAAGHAADLPRAHRHVRVASRSGHDRDEARKRRAVQALGYRASRSRPASSWRSVFPSSDTPLSAGSRSRRCWWRCARPATTRTRVSARPDHGCRLLHRHAVLDHARDGRLRRPAVVGRGRPQRRARRLPRTVPGAVRHRDAARPASHSARARLRRRRSSGSRPSWAAPTS